MSSETPLDQDQKDALANAAKKTPTEDVPPLGYDLSRSYGRNWTKTNVNTLFDWLTVAAFNMQCLEYAIEKHRASIRNFTIYGLVVSTLSGTISLSQFGIETGHVSNKILQGIFTFFTFSLAIYTGYVKIYQIQERLEQFIKLRQDWAVFATTIGSELQLPIDLRRDALHLIVKYKSTYLDLIKLDIEIPEKLRIRAEQSLPKTDSHIQVTNLPSTIINIGIQEMDDLNSERNRDKDRFSVARTAKVAPAPSVTAASKKTPPAQAAATQAAATPAPAASATKTVKAEQMKQIQVKPTLPSNLDVEITGTPFSEREFNILIESNKSETGLTGATGTNHTEVGGATAATGATGATGTA
jgi:hypothetical protein